MKKYIFSCLIDGNQLVPIIVSAKNKNQAIAKFNKSYKVKKVLYVIEKDKPKATLYNREAMMYL